MKVLVALEARFLGYHGQVYYHHLSYEGFWTRYLEVFDSVLVAARVKGVKKLPGGVREVSGPNVEFNFLPDYHGPREYWGRRKELQSVMRRAVASADAFILRVPGTIGTLAWKSLPRGMPFGVEVVQDPWLSLAPGSVRGAGRSIFRRLGVRHLRSQCARAAAASYVTQCALQKLYPPGKNTFVTHYSSADLPAEAILKNISERREAIATISARLQGGDHPVRLGFIGSFSQGYKLPHIHIEALARCTAKGSNLTLDMIGEGELRGDMERLAGRLGVADRINFHGRIAGGRAVLEALDTFDVFLNATAAEGLPRVVIEAMARGCPCIASDVGGTSELVPQSHLVIPGNARALADKILEVLSDPEGMSEMAERNLRIAGQYTPEILTPRRRLFYEELRRRVSE